MGLRIKRSPSPFSPAVEARPHERFFPHAHGNELPVAAYLRKTLHCPRVRFGRPVGEHVCGASLPRKGRRFGGIRLLLGGNLARDVAGQRRAVLDGKERCSINAIKQKKKTLLRSLGN